RPKRSGIRLRSTELPDGRPNSEFRKMETPGLRPGPTTNRQRRSRRQPCKHCAASVRQKRIPASSKRRKMHLVGARVKEIARIRERAISPGKGSVTAETQTFLPVFRVMAGVR